MCKMKDDIFACFPPAYDYSKFAACSKFSRDMINMNVIVVPNNNMIVHDAYPW